MFAPTITHCEIFGQNTTCAPVISKLINANGNRHFQANPITWSMRKRGNVARTQIITVNTAKTLTRNQSTGSTGSEKDGPLHPPRYNVVIIVDTAIASVYSVR